MAVTISAIYRYPVKGLSPEPLGRVRLTPGRCLPQDRRFAIALPSTRLDPERPEWLAKTHFVMLMRDEKLAQLTTRFDAETDLLTIERDGGTVLRESLADTEGRRRAATQVNPATAERDLDIVGGLQRGFGHNLMGIYGEVTSGGDIAAGDAIMVETT
jgi:uncharacterized protein YcbX